MKTNRKINPLAVIFAVACLMVAITVLIIFIIGYRYTTLANGAKFIGKSENGQPVSGTIKYQTGTEAELDFFNKTIKYSNGDVYVGDISGGLRDGKGRMEFSATGDVYEGDFKNDEITGYGTFTYAQGDVYTGFLINSKKNGQGKFVSANGNVYEGNYVDDVRSGEGKFVWASGAVYEGEFADDLKSGKGVMIYDNGDKYEGTFKNDMRDGDKGIYTWANGERYNGPFRNNLQDTRLVDENGNFIVNEYGEYVHGEKATYYFTTGRQYRGYFTEGKANDVVLQPASEG